MSQALHVLMVEDSADDARLMRQALKRAGWDIHIKRVEEKAALRDALALQAWNVILVDYSLPGFDGLEALKIIRQEHPDLPVILVSGTVGEEIAVEAMKAGANDYVMKDKLVRLAPAVAREVREAGERRRRRTLEVQLDKEAARFRALIEKSWDGIVVVDGAGRLIYGSPSAERLMGYQPDHLLGRNLFELVFPEDRPGAEAAFAEAEKARGGSPAREVRVVRRDGAVRWFELTATNLIDVPSVRGVVVNFRDVTERREAEEALRESESLFRDTFEQAPVGIALSVDDGPYARVNGRFCQIMGYTREELLGLGFRAITLPEDLPDDLAAGQGLLTGAIQSHNRDKRYRRKDGGIIWTNRTISLRRAADGRPLYFIDVVEDISDRKKAEERLALFRALVEHSYDAIEVIDPLSLRFLDVNESACRNLGYTRDELLALTVSDVDANAGETEFIAIGERLKKGEAITFESRHRRRDGTLFPVEVSMSSVTLDRPYVVAVARDITERKLAEQALRESESRYRILFEGAAEGILVADIETRRLGFANPTVCRMFGYTPDEIGRLCLDDLHPKAALPQVMIEFTAQARQEKVVAYALPCVRKDGSVFNADVKTSVATLDGRLCAVGFFTDISDRKQAEEALVQERRLLLALTENIPDSIYFKDRESRFILINPAQARHLGVTAAAAIGRTDFDFFTDEYARHAFEDEQVIIRTGEPVLNKEEMETWTDGRVTWVATTKMALRDSAGEIVGTFGISRDITEQKSTQERLREQAALLDQANDAIMVRDLEHRIRYWNRSAERLYGWTAAEALGCVAPDLLQAVAVEHEVALREVMKTGDWTQEMHYLNRSGRKLVVLSRWSLLRDELDRPRAILAINTDVTEKKQLEAQYLRAQRQESIGALASGIAHDLNNVLTPIILGTTLVRQAVTDPTAQRMLALMDGNARRGAEIVRQVLAFARGTGGKRTTLQLRYLAAEMAKIAEATFPKNIRVTTDLAADLWAIEGNPTEVHQALMNLCVNARDAMPAGGDLTLALANANVDEAQAARMTGGKPGRHVRVRVSDTGTGMTPEVMERIFEPFFTTKGVGVGTGLGLATVLGIMRGHGGFIGMASTVNHGTTFDLYFPAASGAADAVRPGSATPLVRGMGETLLLIDDEAAVRDMARRALEENGYRVILAESGTEAVQAFLDFRKDIQVVITDMMMPETDGPTLVRTLRTIDPGLRILGITGVADTTALGQLKALNLGAVLAKPFAVSDLLTAVHEVLAGAGQTNT